MAILAQRVTVGSTPTALNAADSDSLYIRIKVRTAATTVSVGGSAVTITDGYEIDSLGEFSIQLAAGERLYAVHATGGVRVDVLSTGIG